jgi:hypothetical protein
VWPDAPFSCSENSWTCPDVAPCLEAEVRAILTYAVAEPGEAPGLLQAIIDRFGEMGGVELDLPPRATRPRAAEFGS